MHKLPPKCFKIFGLGGEVKYLNVTTLTVLTYFFSVGVLFYSQIDALNRYSNIVDLPITQNSTLVSGYGATGNSLTHIHVSKAMVSGVISLFSNDASIASGDSGAPFFSLLGSNFAASHFALLLIFLFLCIRVVVTSRAEWSSSSVLLWAVATFVVAKSSVDGGIYSRGVFFFILSSVVMLWNSREQREIRSHASEKFTPKSLLILYGASVLVTFLSSSFWFFAQSDMTEKLSDLFSQSVVENFTPLAVVVLLGVFEIPRSKSLVRLFAGIFYVFQILSSHTVLNEAQYLVSEVGAGSIIRFFLPKTVSHYEEVSVSTPQRMLLTHTKYNLRPGVRAVTSSVNSDCAKLPVSASLDVKILSGQYQQPREIGWIESIKAQRCSPKSWCDYHLSVKFNGCTPLESVFHKPLLVALSLAGMDMYVVRNFTYHSYNP